MMRVAVIVAVLAGACASSFAQMPPSETRRPYAPENSEAGTSRDHERARLLGLLIYRNVSIDFDDTPIADVIHDLQRQIGVTIIARYTSERHDSGIERDSRVTAQLKNVAAIRALEEILSQCGDCTWQLREGFVEVSTRDRLSAKAARETRLYHVRDLMLEPPYFGGDDGGVRVTPRIKRKTPEQLVRELFDAIVATVEPEAWEPPDDGSDVRFKPLNDRNRLEQGRQPPHIVGKWASMRVFRDQLIVTAPDFIHRQIGGYPQPIAPANDDESEVTGASKTAQPVDLPKDGPMPSPAPVSPK